MILRPELQSRWWMAAGITPVGAWSPIGAASESASRTNLANPGVYDLAAYGSPSFSATTGWSGFSTSVFYSTGIAPSTGCTGLIVFDSVPQSGVQLLCGAARAANVFYWNLTAYASGRRYYVVGGSAVFDGGPAVSGTSMAIAGGNCYHNGSSSGTATQGTLPDTHIAIGGRRKYGENICDYSCAGNIRAFLLFASTLTADQIAALHTARP